MLSRKKDFMKIDNFSYFPSLSATLVRLSIKTDDCGFDFQRTYLSGIFKGLLRHHKCYGYIESASIKELLFLALAYMLHKNNQCSRT